MIGMLATSPRSNHPQDGGVRVSLAKPSPFGHVRDMSAFHRRVAERIGHAVHGGGTRRARHPARRAIASTGPGYLFRSRGPRRRSLRGARAPPAPHPARRVPDRPQRDRPGHPHRSAPREASGRPDRATLRPRRGSGMEPTPPGPTDRARRRSQRMPPAARATGVAVDPERSTTPRCREDDDGQHPPDRRGGVARCSSPGPGGPRVARSLFTRGWLFRWFLPRRLRWSLDGCAGPGSDA